jgi:hypothetical protein
MVTAAADTVDRVVGLETGADDYIAKPVRAARIARAREERAAPYHRGDRKHRPACAHGPPGARSREARVDRSASGDEETLAASELDLLKVFAENPNRPLNRDWLLEVTAHREMEAFDARSTCASRGCAARSRSTPRTPTRSARCAASATCSCRRRTRLDLMKLEGGCYCGRLRYLAEGEPTLKAQCHCRECQYISGGSPNMFLLMPSDGFRTPRARQSSLPAAILNVR